MRKMTQKEFLKDFNQCPNCRSKEVEGDSFEAGSRDAWQEVKCLSCGASWLELYTLSGYDNLWVPGKEQKKE